MNTSKGIFVLLAALAAAMGCKMEPAGEREVIKGCNPAFSPDGKRLAFQRLDGDVFKIGVTGLSGGAIE